MVIYVAGPLSAKVPSGVPTNVARAIDISNELVKRGYAPIVPHLSYYQNLRAQAQGKGIDYETWMSVDFRLLERCDAMFVIAQSPGTNREILFARDLGIPIFTSLEELEDFEPPMAGIPPASPEEEKQIADDAYRILNEESQAEWSIMD